MSKEQLELHAAELELKRLKLEVSELEKPFYLKYQFLSIFTPVLIALIPFLTVGVQAYFDSTKRKLEQTKQSLVAETQALSEKNLQLKQDIEQLSKTSLAYLNQLSSQHQDYTQQMANITGKLNDEIKKDSQQQLDAKEKSLLSLDQQVSLSIKSSSQEHLQQVNSLNENFAAELSSIKKQLNQMSTISATPVVSENVAKLN